MQSFLPLKMADHGAKASAGTISEDDMSALLQRYNATKVLTLLQEVSNSAGASIDWDALVRKTSTGISNAREYQMLWRHLAYRNPLVEKLDVGAVPLDDDSDVEFELEVTPAISAESSAQVANCVKVLIGSDVPSEFIVPSVEAPLTTNVPNGRSSKGRLESSQAPPSISGMNKTVPSVQKQSLSKVTPPGVLDGNQPQKKKRKSWSKAEDQELISAVQKYGEGNWENILKRGFKVDRTAAQLLQRWNQIGKRQKDSNVGGGSLNGTKFSEAVQAAHHAIKVALGNPDRVSPSGIANMQTPKQSQPALLPPKPSPAGDSRSVVSIKRPPLKPHTHSDSTGLQAAAVAAGARIATPTPSVAASLMMAAQAKKSVHVVPSAGTSTINRNISGGSAISGAFPNVHHIRTGLSIPPLSSQPARPSGATHIGLLKPASDSVRSIPASAAPNPFEPQPLPQQEASHWNEQEVSELTTVPKKQSQKRTHSVMDDHANSQVEIVAATRALAETLDQANADREVRHGQSLGSDITKVCPETTEETPGVDGKLGVDLRGLAVNKEGSEVQVVSSLAAAGTVAFQFG